MRAVTFSEASLPTLSSDGSKIAYLSENKLYTLDLSESPLGLLNRESKLVSTTSLPPPNLGGGGRQAGGGISSLEWSPDNKQILLFSTPSAYLADLTKQEVQPVLDLKALRKEWSNTKDIRLSRNTELLPQQIRNILASSAAELVWSPKENKVLYTATASAVIPENLIPQLPGSNSQPQERQLRVGKKYVYDLEEDRNFNIQCLMSNIQWFSDSNHIICVQNKKIVIMEYDGTNPTTVYTGPMESDFVAAYPSAKQLLILTNLTGNSTIPPNLYAVSLR